jgi:methionine aminopeptidase
MPRKELQNKRLPFFVRLKTVPAMTAVARMMGEIKAEVQAMEDARKALPTGNQREALIDIAVSGMNASAKADEIISKVGRIRNDIQEYLKQVKNGTD